MNTQWLITLVVEEGTGTVLRVDPFGSTLD